MSGPEIDLDLMATHLRSKLEEESLSVRAAADEIGCSPATLSRMLRGTKAANHPEAKNLFKAASWLGRSISDFERGSAKAETTIADVEVHLRALPDLRPEDKEALVAMVKAAHDAAIHSRKNPIGHRPPSSKSTRVGS